MLEIEAKFPVNDHGAVERHLQAWGAQWVPVREDIDRYFNAPDRDFARTDEALRIRSIGQDNFVTYKGPKTEAQTKTRTEIEVPLGAGTVVAEEFGRVLTHLGYRAVAVVRKQRAIAHLQREGFDLEVCLDTVEEVGRFVEVEIMAQPEVLDAARAVLLKTAAELGLKNQERRSYLEMLLTKNRTKRTKIWGDELLVARHNLLPTWELRRPRRPRGQGDGVPGRRLTESWQPGGVAAISRPSARAVAAVARASSGG
jgi:adenylate cyclase class 2